MLFLIEKDTATRIPREGTLDEAKALADQFPVHVVKEDGSTQPLADYLAEQEPVTGEQLVHEPAAVVLSYPEISQPVVVASDAAPGDGAGEGQGAQHSEA